MPAQAEIRQARGESAEEEPPHKKLSLLQRLANVGLGRRDEETEPPIAAARASGPAMAPLPPLRIDLGQACPAPRAGRPCNRNRAPVGWFRPERP